MLKRWNLLLYTAVFWLGLSGTALADSSAQLLAQIARISANPEALQANFTQSKNIKGFRSPMQSSGKVILARQKGMLWVTEQPYQSTLKINPNGISEVRNGQTQQLGNAQSMSAMTQVMSSMLAGDFSSLQRYFSFTGKVSGNSWNLSLQPSDAQVKRVISSIQLRGGQYVNQAVIREMNGDITTIRFLNPRAVSPATVGF